MGVQCHIERPAGEVGRSADILLSGFELEYVGGTPNEVELLGITLP